jgi:pimeloyl-ACP methyl ester carboxylesterase
MLPRILQHDVSGDGEPLILIPGGLTGWVSWIPLQDRLARRRKAIRVQPIYNELGSAGHPRHPDHSRHIEHESLHLTLVELGIERADLAGWSAGGKMLIDFAAVHQDMVRSLTLIEPGAHWILDQLGETDPRLQASNQFLWGLTGREISEDDLAVFMSSAGFVENAAQARQDPYWVRALPHRMTLSWLDEELMASDLSVGDLARIQSPTLLTKGSVTEPWERRTVDLLGKYLPNARVVEFEGGHAHHIENLDAFAGVMEDHLQAAEVA